MAGKKSEPEVEAAEAETPEAEQTSGTANPPTEVVDGTEPMYPPEPVEGVDTVPPAAPVWEGGDPGTAVPSPNDTPDYYHPVPEAPEADAEAVDDDETPVVDDAETPVVDDAEELADDVDEDDDDHE